MAKKHGARQQKRIAKQKAKRLEKRSILFKRNTTDPTIRLQQAEKWPVVEARVGANLWNEGIGYLTIARQAPNGQLAFAGFLVDVYCLGVKNAFWHAGTGPRFTSGSSSRCRSGPWSGSCSASMPASWPRPVA